MSESDSLSQIRKQQAVNSDRLEVVEKKVNRIVWVGIAILSLNGFEVAGIKGTQLLAIVTKIIGL